MSKNIVEVDTEYQEEEIDIYKLLDIFIRNIKVFVVISAIGIIATGIFIVKSIFMDKRNIVSLQYTLNYSELESYLAGKVYYPKRTPSDMLLDDKYLEKLFDNENIKLLYEKNVTEDRNSISSKREFLNNSKILENISMKKVVGKDEQDTVSGDSYKLIIRTKKNLDRDKSIAYSFIETYEKLLKEYYQENMFNYIAERKIFLEKALAEISRQLEENAVDGSSLNINSTNNENNFLKYIYPIKVSNIDSYYSNYTRYESEYQAIKNLFELNLDNVNNFIKHDTSTVEEIEKSRNVLFLGIGLFISFISGVIGVFSKEFIEGYKKSKE